MKPLSKAEGLQLIRDVTNHTWEHLAFFDKKTIDKINGTAPIDVVATICHVVLFLSAVCDAVAIPFHTSRLYFILIKDKCYDWFLDDTRQKLVRDYNDQLFCDLKQNEV